MYDHPPPIKPMKLHLAITLLLATLTGILSAQEETPEQKGYRVAAESDRSDRGFKNSTVELEMTLKNATGRESRRNLTISTLEIPDEQVGDKSLVVFSNPRDIKGTALLSHAKIIDADDQWLYLPALKRVKRISSSNKSGPFVGSEFAFEDFTTQELNKFTYKWLRSESYSGMDCEVVERVPRYKYSGYSKQISWTDKTHKQVRKVEFYDRRGALLKTLNLTNYKRYEDKIWRALTMTMVNAQTKKQTVLTYKDYRFGTGLTDKNFVSSALTRIR